MNSYADYCRDFLFNDAQTHDRRYQLVAAATMVEHARDKAAAAASIRQAIDENLEGVTEYSPATIAQHDAWKILRRASRLSTKAATKAILAR